MSKKKILLIEDTTATIDLIREILSNANYDVFISTNGEWAISKAEINLPDLILLDILMPGIDGFETCKRLKSNNKTKDIPVIFMSALAESFDKVKAFQLGAVDYVTKPINNEELLARVNTHIELRKARQKIEESENSLKKIIDNQGEGFGITDTEENFTYVNPIAEKIFGVPENTLVGRNLQDFLDTKQFIKIKQQTKIRKTGEFSTYEIIIIKPNKQKRQLLVTATPNFDKNRIFQGTIGVFRDITIRKNAEDALKNMNVTLEQKVEERTKQLGKSEQKFRNLFFENPVSLWEEDISEVIKLLDDKKKEGITDFIKYFNEKPEFVYKCASKIKILNINQATVDIHKAPSKEYLIKNLINTFNDRTIKTFKRILVAISEGKNSFQEETEYLNFKGEIFAAIIQFSLIKNSNNILVSIADISQLKKTEYALRDSEERLLEAQKIAKMGHWHLDLVKDKLIWSDEIYRIFDLTPQEFEANYEAFLNAIHPDDRKMVNKSYLNSVKNKTDYNIQYRLLLKNNEIKYVHEKGRTEYDDKENPLFSIGTIQDITQQKKIENEMKKLNTAVEQSANIVLITNKQGRIEYVNKKFVELTGYSKKEAIGKTPNMLKSEKQSEKFYKQLWTNIKMGKEWKGVFQNKKKNGELYWESATISPIFNDKGTITNFIGIKEDITEQKLMKQKISNAIIKAEEKERARLAKDLHDGIGPLLSAAKLYIESLKYNESKKLTEKTFVKFNEIIDEAILSAKEIANNLSPHLLKNHGLTAAIKTFSNKLLTKENIAINIRSNLDIRISENIEISIYRIVIELINNTLKYAKASIIDIDINTDNNNLLINYADNGIGFDVKKTLDILTGLGFSNILNRIEILNGKLDIDSQPGKGSIFKIKVPLIL